MGLVLRGPYYHIAARPARDWYDLTWDLAHGCSQVSAGCANCAAAEVLGRMGDPVAAPLTPNGRDVRWLGEVRTRPRALLEWPWDGRQGALVFVMPYSDFFHDEIVDAFRDAAWDVMAAQTDVRFVILTKRSAAMRRYVNRHGCPENVGLAVSVEDRNAKHRVIDLLDTDTKLRAVSAEPLLELVDLRSVLGPQRVNWVIAGPELGVNQRHCDPEWMRVLRDQARTARVPFFTKHELDGRDHREYPTWAGDRNA